MLERPSCVHRFFGKLLRFRDVLSSDCRTPENGFIRLAGADKSSSMSIDLQLAEDFNFEDWIERKVANEIAIYRALHGTGQVERWKSFLRIIWLYVEIHQDSYYLGGSYGLCPRW